MKTVSIFRKKTGSSLDESGRVGPPILLWLLGVPGGVCFLLWLFFFRSH